MPIDINRCWVEWTSIGFDQRAYICRQRDWTTPLGVVIGTAHYVGIDDGATKESFFNVELSYVTEWARREGVRTLINEAIFNDFPAITTAGHTSLGHKFMKSQGYKKHPQLGWILKRRNKPKKKGKKHHDE